MTSAVSFFDVRDSFQDVKTPKTSTSASTASNKWQKLNLHSFRYLDLPVAIFILYLGKLLLYYFIFTFSFEKFLLYEYVSDVFVGTTKNIDKT